MEISGIITTIIAALGGGGIGGGIISLANWKSRKKIESANADKAASEADTIDLSNLQTTIKIIGDRLANTENELTSAYNKIAAIRKELTKTKEEQFRQTGEMIELRTALDSAEYFKCFDEICVNRKPPRAARKKREEVL